MKKNKVLSMTITLVAILAIIISIFILESNNRMIYAVEGDAGKEILNSSEVYVLPILNSSIIGNLEKGDNVKIISVNGQWSFVQNNEIRGWIYSKNVETSTTNDNSNSNNNISEETSNDNTTISEDEETNTAAINDTNENTNSSNTIQNEDLTNITYPITMYVNVDAVNIRESASTTSKVVTSVGINCPVRVTAKEGDWFKVEVSDGKGYIKTEFLSLNKN